ILRVARYLTAPNRNNAPVARQPAIAGRNAMANDDDNVVHITKPQDWRLLCQKNEKKKLLANFHNAMIALKHDPAVRDFVGYDEMLRAPVVLHEIGLIDTCHRWLTDTDAIAVMGWLQHNGFPSIGLEIVRQALQARAAECSFHP